MVYIFLKLVIISFLVVCNSRISGIVSKEMVYKNHLQMTCCLNS